MTLYAPGLRDAMIKPTMKSINSILNIFEHLACAFSALADYEVIFDYILIHIGIRASG
jgi:hypothetical protein